MRVKEYLVRSWEPIDWTSERGWAPGERDNQIALSAERILKQVEKKNITQKIEMHDSDMQGQRPHS